MDCRFDEFSLATTVGVPVEVCREIRARWLTEGSDWRHWKGYVLLSKEAAGKVLAVLGIAYPEKGPEPTLGGILKKCDLDRPGKPPKEIELVVWNPHPSPTRNDVILAQGKSGTAYRVLVGCNANFVYGMKIKATPVAAGVYQLVGPCPRERGRW
jgi:hypothetical protein